MISRIAIAIFLAGAAAGSLALAGGHEGTAPDGKTVFENHCANCHTGGFGGFFTGAPKVGKASDWETLRAKGSAGLTATTISGIGKMEPRGGCAACSDEDLAAAVGYMLEQSSP